MIMAIYSSYVKATNIKSFIGNLWPVNGQPLIMRTIGRYLPATKPTAAGLAIGAKGLMLPPEIVFITFFSTCV